MFPIIFLAVATASAKNHGNNEDVLVKVTFKQSVLKSVISDITCGNGFNSAFMLLLLKNTFSQDIYLAYI